MQEIGSTHSSRDFQFIYRFCWFYCRRWLHEIIVVERFITIILYVILNGMEEKNGMELELKQILATKIKTKTKKKFHVKRWTYIVIYLPYGCFSFAFTALFTLFLFHFLLLCVQSVHSLFNFLHISGSHCKRKKKKLISIGKQT